MDEGGPDNEACDIHFRLVLVLNHVTSQCKVSRAELHGKFLVGAWPALVQIVRNWLQFIGECCSRILVIKLLRRRCYSFHKQSSKSVN